jgi:FkbM family methyltransferase
MKLARFEADNGFTVNALENSRFVFDEIWKEGIYDRHFAIKPGMSVLDIGANQGFFSLYAAGKGASVVSVEPEETNFGILERNIADNGLENRIIPFKAALSGKSGTIRIYSESFEDPVASFIVSTSRTFLSDRDRLSRSRAQLVECLSLADLMTVSGMARFDLVKIDCEGAEWGILKSAPRPVFDRIDNIVMETHVGYSQRELAGLLVGMGFDIVAFEPIDQHTRTGYLFASGKNLGRTDTLKHPVLISSVPALTVRGRTFNPDNSESFSPVGEILKTEWVVDGVPAGRSTPGTLKWRFGKTGPHVIDCRVRDESGRTEMASHSTYCLEKNYFRPVSNLVNLASAAEQKKILIHGKGYCFIPKIGDWQPDEIVIGVEIAEPKRESPQLRFNGTSFKLDREYNKIKLENIPKDLDIRFVIESKRVMMAGLMWWPDVKPREIVIPDSELPQNVMVLKQRNTTQRFTVKEPTDLFLHHLFLKQIVESGKDPGKIEVCVTAVSPDKCLDGLFVEKGFSSECLEGKFRTLSFEIDDFDRDLVFTIGSIGTAKNIEIEWWW